VSMTKNKLAGLFLIATVLGGRLVYQGREFLQWRRAPEFIYFLIVMSTAAAVLGLITTLARLLRPHT